MSQQEDLCKKVYELRGYSPDFYVCVCIKIEQGVNFDKAIAQCELLYS